MIEPENQRHATSVSLPPATSLLDVFSRRGRAVPSPSRWSYTTQALWDSDAIHRANNLAQMATSLSRIDPVRFGLAADALIASHAEALAAIYAEIGTAGETAVRLPCATLLQRMSTTLVAMFGDHSNIRLRFHAHDLLLAPDRRRAVNLIASELVINALKYAFVDARAGVIHVALTASGGIGELVVEDDGAGISGPHHVGTGSGLVAAMTGLVDGHFERGSRTGGGTRCSVTFPLHVTESDLCPRLAPACSDKAVALSKTEGN